MDIHYHVRGLSPNALAARPLDLPLKRLNHSCAIMSADVMLESHRETTPAFLASVELAVPGPDFIHATVRDHTLPGAMLQVVRRLRELIKERKRRRQGRALCSRVPGPWAPRLRP